LLLLRDGAIPGIEHLLDLDELVHDDIFKFVIFSLLDLAIRLFYEVFKGMLQAMLSGKQLQSVQRHFTSVYANFPAEFGLKLLDDLLKI